VQGDQRDRVGAGLIRILVGDERRLLEEPIQGVVRGEIVVARRDGPQLEQVRPALLASLGAVREHRPVSRLLQDRVQQLGQGQHSDPGPQPSHQRGEPAQGGPGPGSQPLDAALRSGLHRAPVGGHALPAAAPAATNPRSSSRLFSPIPRAGTLSTRSKLTWSASLRRIRRYASASLTSRRW